MTQIVGFLLLSVCVVVLCFTYAVVHSSWLVALLSGSLLFSLIGVLLSWVHSILDTSKKPPKVEE